MLFSAIGYSKGQFVRVSNGVIALLSHADADYRLRAATVLAELGQETKAIDIALLNSFLNDPRVCSYLFSFKVFIFDNLSNRFLFELNVVIH